MSARLQIDGLSGGYGDTRVLFDVTCSVDAGHLCGVFGRNGVGKTTLAKVIQGSLRPFSGHVRFDGQEISALAANRRRALGLGYMPQTAMVFDDLTVRENLMLGQGRVSSDKYFDRFPRLAERLDQPAGTMSGGERKILSFVRTMIEDTHLLVLDEPSEGVQPENIQHMADCLDERRQAGCAIVLCEQNLGFLTSIATHLVGLESGRVVLNCAADAASSDDIQAVISL